MEKTNDPSKKLLRIFLLIVLSLCALCAVELIVLFAVRASSAKNPEEQPAVAEEKADNFILEQTADAGAEYQNKLFFFGESTTSHLARSGGVLDGTRQVFKTPSGTLTLDENVSSAEVLYTPKDGEQKTVSFSAALQEEQPEYLVLSFGLNGINEFSESPDGFVKLYQKLITEIQKESPNTKIILQSVFPVAAACTSFSSTPENVNRKIEGLNSYIKELAQNNQNVKYADTASALKDGYGMLVSSFDNGDGIHLTNEAYGKILSYLRTHAWQV